MNRDDKKLMHSRESLGFLKLKITVHILKRNYDQFMLLMMRSILGFKSILRSLT